MTTNKSTDELHMLSTVSDYSLTSFTHIELLDEKDESSYEVNYDISTMIRFD